MYTTYTYKNTKFCNVDVVFIFQMRNRLETDYLRVPHWLTPCFGFYFIPKSQAHTFVQELRGSELDCFCLPQALLGVVPRTRYTADLP